MRRFFIVLLLFPFISNAQFQAKKKTTKDNPKTKTTASAQRTKEKKYPSLLWEISGKGMKKPSYLFGTMHISNKLAFHLGDSFYTALRSVDVVALEQDPDLWQEEYSKRSDKGNDYSGGFNAFSSYRGYRPNDRLTIGTFSVKGYEERLKAAFPLEARMINGMLYRTDPNMEDFEEETYLDMYIYQSGKRLNKIVTGVENFKETEALVKKAYKALIKEQYSKKKSYDYGTGILGYKKSEEAYRNGDLDLIDSIEMAGVISEEFQENFMYKRNEIQANSIDTILKKHSLFVGVGAAHLPGKKGVIELLRKMGYTVRPIMMGERNSEEKERIEKIRVPVSFKEQWVDDSLFSVKIPGNKLYRYPAFDGVDMQQYADMANGSYYLVTRLRTNAAILGHTPDIIMKKIDSLLYENIPGKIITKKIINQQGVKGYEIVNKTRKGDAQHYHIYVLPDEVIILKASGVGDYVTGGDEAETFLSSIRFKSNTQPVNYTPPYGGFSINFPSAPSYLSTERNAKNRQEWSAVDANGNAYLLFKTNLHHYDYLETDTFELNLAEESFASSAFISKTNSKAFSTLDKFPILLSEYTHKDGSIVNAGFVIKGNNYYVLATKSKKGQSAQPFAETLRFTDFAYPETKPRADSAIGFSVKSPLWYPPKTEEEDDFANIYMYMRQIEDEDGESDYFENLGGAKTAFIGNDTTGEHIYVYRYMMPEFNYSTDTVKYMQYQFHDVDSDSDYIVYKQKEWKNDNGWMVKDFELRDTGSSRAFIGKNMYKQGVAFSVFYATDTLTHLTPFARTFFETFTPADTLKFRDPFKKTSDQFFAQYFNTDTTVQKKARKKISSVMFDSTDLPNIKRAISELTWKSKKYLATKQQWISVLGEFSDSATVDYLEDLYAQAKDTSDLQNEILDALVSMRTKYAYSKFKTLLLKDPPALLDGSDNSYDYVRSPRMYYGGGSSYDYVDYDYDSHYYGKWGALYDTLQLTVQILPELVDLMILEDYAPTVVNLLVTSVDSGYLKADQYKQFYNRFSLEAKQMLKKQFATEDKKAIDKASATDKERENYYDDESNDRGNSKLVDYAVLLMPFWENTEIQSFFNKLITTTDKQLRTDIALLMLRNKKSVHDTLIEAVAALDNYRIQLYNNLEEARLLDKYPAKYKKQEDFARSMLQRNSYNKPDSLIFLRKDSISYEGERGWLYFYKYKKAKDDTEWKIAVSGMQPFEQDKVIAKFEGYKRLFTDFTNEEYIDDASLTDQLPKIIKEMKYEKRSSSRSFYSDKNNELYEVVLSDRVKRNRYD